MKRLLIILATTSLIAAASLASFAAAQPDQANTSTDQSMGAMHGASPGMGMMHQSVAVDNTSIYVIRGNQLMKFNKNTMALVSSTTLPPMSGMTATTGQGPAMTGMSQQSMMGQGPSDTQALANQICQMSSVNAELTVLQQLFARNNGTIALSQLAATNASRFELRDFAQRVSGIESRANDRFSNWLGTWYSATPETQIPMGYQQMLQQLQSLSGRDFDIAYMRAMINHLQGNIMIVRQVSNRAPHADMMSASSNMLNNYQTWTQQLRNWLSDWYNVAG